MSPNDRTATESKSGNCSLVIRGTEIDFGEIDINLKIKPTRIIRRGDVLSKTIGPSQYDIWIYEIRHDESGDPNKTLKTLLSIFKSSGDFLRMTSKLVDVSVKCFVQSDLAQIGFEFSPEVIKNLADIGIKFELSILSWGGVEDK